MAREAIEVVCRKDDLEQRMTYQAVPAHEVKLEAQPAPEPAKRDHSAGEVAAGVAAELAHGVLYVFAPQVLPPVAIAALAVAVATAPTHGYQPLPRMLLAPPVFDSESSRDAYFASLQARLEAEADAQRARIRESCHPWPCKASDPICPSPLCEGQRGRVDAELSSQLDQIPALRARARVVPP
jgi:hypothetical protein